MLALERGSELLTRGIPVICVQGGRAKRKKPTPLKALSTLALMEAA